MPFNKRDRILRSGLGDAITLKRMIETGAISSKTMINAEMRSYYGLYIPLNKAIAILN